MNSWTQESRAENIYWSNTRVLKAFLLKPKIEEKENRLRFISLRTSKLQIFSSRLLHLNDLQGISNRRWKRKFKSGNFSFLQSEEDVNSQLGAYHQKNGSAWKSTSDEEWVFFNDFCLKGTPRLLKSSRMVSSMKKFVKSSQRTNKSSTFSVSMSPATFWKSYVEDMKNFVTRHLYSKKKRFSRKSW